MKNRKLIGSSWQEVTTMIIGKSIEQINEIVNNLNKDELALYVFEYIKDHTYFNTKHIAKDYIYKNYKVTHYNSGKLYASLINQFSYRFRVYMFALIRADVIIRYSATNYKKNNGNKLSLEMFNDILKDYNYYKRGK
jgi:hypothetical protein